jgi:Tol biopolymer transport system component
MKLQRTQHSKLAIMMGLAAILLLMPAVLKAQERIAYTTTVDNNTDVWSMKTDASDPRRLTTNAAGDGDPSFSKDGSKIAFVSVRDGNSEVYVMNADGTNQKRLTNNPATDNDPTWSPDGSKILFVSFRDSNAEVYVMNSDGSNQVNLTNAAGNDIEPAYSPDGKQIAFRGLRDGGMNIYVMKPDGSEQMPLTSDTGFNREPSFSPDGSKIVFRSNRDGNQEIYLMDSDGDNQVNLTNTPDAGEFKASFSPDGQKIIFSDGNNDLFVMDDDGQNRSNLTNTPATGEFDPSWGAANVAPVLSDVSITAQIDEGGFATLTGKISDANDSDNFRVGIEWGPTYPGTQFIDLPAGTRNFEFSQKFWDDKPDNTASDTYTIKVTVDDHRFGVSETASTSLTVNNVAPLLVGFAVTPSTVVLGGTVKLSGSVEDPGYISDAADEALRLSLDWGDGASEIMDLFQPGPLSIPPSHKYSAFGTYVVTLKATDNDLGETVQTFEVVVSPPPPPAAPSDLRVDFIAANRVQIVWTDNSDNEDGFAIERCAQRGCNNFIEIGRVFPGIQHFVDSQLFPNTQYYYRVRAFNSGGTSAYTDVVSAKTLKK